MRGLFWRRENQNISVNRENIERAQRGPVGATEIPRDAKIIEIHEETNQIERVIIARALLQGAGNEQRVMEHPKIAPSQLVR